LDLGELVSAIRIVELTAKTRPAAIRALVQAANWEDEGIASDVVLEAIEEREAAAQTLVASDFALPHAFIDWDGARPNEPLLELGAAAWQYVPLFDDAYCAEMGFSETPDRCARLRLFGEAYGVGGDRLFDAVREAKQREAERPRYWPGMTAAMARRTASCDVISANGNGPGGSTRAARAQTTSTSLRISPAGGSSPPSDRRT